MESNGLKVGRNHSQNVFFIHISPYHQEQPGATLLTSLWSFLTLSLGLQYFLSYLYLEIA